MEIMAEVKTKLLSAEKIHDYSNILSRLDMEDLETIDYHEFMQILCKEVIDNPGYCKIHGYSLLEKTLAGVFDKEDKKVK